MPPLIPHQGRNQINHNGSLPYLGVPACGEISGVAPFKDSIPPYGDFANTTDCTGPHQLPITQTTYGDGAPLKITKSDGTITNSITWKSSENAYHGQKLLELKKRINNTEFTVQAGTTKAQLLLELDTMILELAEMPTAPTNVFLPRRNHNGGDTIADNTFDGLLDKFLGPNANGELKKHFPKGPLKTLGNTIDPYQSFNKACDAYTASKKDAYMEFVVEMKLKEYPLLMEQAKNFALNGIMPIEVSRNDEYWASGANGNGQNKLGIIILKLGNKYLQQDKTFKPPLKILNPEAEYNAQIKAKGIYGYYDTQSPMQQGIMISGLSSYVSQFNPNNQPPTPLPKTTPPSSIVPAVPTPAPPAIPIVPAIPILPAQERTISYSKIDDSTGTITIKFASLQDLKMFEKEFKSNATMYYAEPLLTEVLNQFPIDTDKLTITINPSKQLSDNTTRVGCYFGKSGKQELAINFGSMELRNNFIDLLDVSPSDIIMPPNSSTSKNAVYFRGITALTPANTIKVSVVGVPPVPTPVVAVPPAADDSTYDSLQKGFIGFSSHKPDLPNHMQQVIAQQKALGKSETAVKQQIAEDANKSRPILHEDVITLIKDFLADKKANGTSEEKALYQNMSTEDFVTRLLTKRPLVFWNGTDDTILRDGTSATRDSLTADKKIPLKDYISYDEMQISAFLGMSSPSYFVNNGNKYNLGKPGNQTTEPFIDRGIIVGQVGARFEKPDVVEYQHMRITMEQNTPSKGYGDDKSISESQKTSYKENSRKFKHWAKFYNVNHFPTYQEAEKKYNQETNNGKNPENAKTYIKIGNDYLHVDVYKARMQKVVETFLAEANARAGDAGQQAYVHATGLGLGVWAIDRQNQSNLLLDVYADVLKKHKFPNIADIDFSCFGDATKFNDKPVHGISYMPPPQDNIVPSSDSPNSQINIHFSNNNPHQKTQAREGKLLVTQYAWDSGSFPGNEFWCGALNSSMDPATGCSSGVTYLQSSINPKVNGKYAVVANTSDELKQLQTATTKTPSPPADELLSSNPILDTNPAPPEATKDKDKDHPGILDKKFNNDFFGDYQKKVTEHFQEKITNNTLKDVEYVQTTIPTSSTDPKHIIGQIKSTASNNKDQILANITQNSIECPLQSKPTTPEKSPEPTLSDTQLNIFATFLEMKSSKTSPMPDKDNMMPINAKNFHPADLIKLLKLLKKIETKVFVDLKLPESIENCKYGNDSKQYTEKEYSTAKEQLADYKKFLLNPAAAPITINDPQVAPGKPNKGPTS